MTHWLRQPSTAADEARSYALQSGELGDNLRAQSSFSDLIFSVNTAARHPAHWDIVLQQIAAEMDATKASMHRHEFARHRHTAGARLHSFGYEKGAGALYAKHFAPHDPYVRRIRDRHPGLSAGTSDDLLTTSELKRTAFYTHYARPNEIFYVSWITVEESDRFGSGLAVVRPEDAVQFSAKHVNFFRSLAPHLGQAFDLQRFIEHLTQKDKLLQTSVDQANVALLALAKDGRVVNMSKSAEGLLERRDPLRLKQGRLQAINPAQDGQLQRTISSASIVWMDAANSSGNTVRMQRKDGRTWLLVKVFAYSASRDLIGSCSPLFGQDEPSVLVLLSDPSRKCAVQEAALRSHLGLNPTEARIAMLLMQNYRQKDIALKLGSSDGNVRQCLHHIYRKTGTDSQVDLLQLLLGLFDHL